MGERRIITVVGCHAGGEVGNVVVAGVPAPAGATVFEQMQALRADDSLRRFLLREPRGSSIYLMKVSPQGDTLWTRTYSWPVFHWPEAIVVYMQGLNTPGVIGDREGKKSGWQKSTGDQDALICKAGADIVK